MSRPPSRSNAEKAVRDQVRVTAAKSLSAVRALDAIFRAAAAELEGESDPKVAEAMSILSYRLADDLRAAELLLERNYRAQALTIGASAMEAALTLRFIDFDSERAARWMSHADIGEPPWRVSKLKQGASGDREVLNDLFYQLMAAVKHHNPRMITKLFQARSLDQYRIAAESAVDPALSGVLLMSASLLCAPAYEAAMALADSGRMSPEWQRRFSAAATKHGCVFLAIFELTARAK
jgi:hypothetical protein